MSAQVKTWQHIIDEFQSRLQEWASGRGMKVDWPPWKAGHRIISSRSILQLGDTPQVLLYVKVRSREPGFWGLTASWLQALRESGREWFVVLLLGSPATGYLLPSTEVNHRAIAERVWHLARDGDFKIHPSGLSEEFYFPSFDALIDSLERQMASPPALERA